MALYKFCMQPFRTCHQLNTRHNQCNILARESVATDDRGRMDLCFHELVGILQQLSSYYYLPDTDSIVQHSKNYNAWCHEHSAVLATELMQPRDLTCGTPFQSSRVILTSPTDCSNDSWRDTFFRKHEHGACVTSDMWCHKKTLTYLLTKTAYSQTVNTSSSMQNYTSCNRGNFLGKHQYS